MTEPIGFAYITKEFSRQFSFRSQKSHLWHQHVIQKQAGLQSAQMPTNKRTIKGLQCHPGCRDVSCAHTSQGLSTGTATYSPLCSFLITTLSQDSKGTLCRRQTGLNTENMGPDAATPRLVMFREGPPRH